MEIKIELKVVKQNGMVAGVGSCSPEEKWLVPHVKAIAEEYAKRVTTDKSIPDADEDEVEDEDEMYPICPYCGEEVDPDDRETMCIGGEYMEYCPECGEKVADEDWE